MTIAYLHIIRLTEECTSLFFQGELRKQAPSYHFEVVVFSQNRHVVAQAKVLDQGTIDREWCCFALLRPTGDGAQQGGSVIPDSLSHLMRRYYTLRCAVPSAILRDFAATNIELHSRSAVDGAAFNETRLEELRRKVADASNRPQGSQKLEASTDLLNFAKYFLPVQGLKPVTMLNLLKFNEGEPGAQSYKTYGQNFKTVGGKRGGNAKIVGKVLDPALFNGTKKVGEEKWDEFAIVHYPNIIAFCDMAAGDDYQEVNYKYRLPALKDTLLLATREMPLAAEPGQVSAKSESDPIGRL